MAELSLEDILTGPYTWKSLQPCDLSKCTKQEILDYFENSYSLNESVFAALRREKAFTMAPDRLRLPLIFYYAHTACVYINKLMLAGLIKERINLEFETMFETGVDEMSWDDTENYRMGGSYQWPSLKDVVAFRLTVRNVIRKVIEDTPLELPVTQDSQWWALFMGFEHERIHLETSSVLIRQLPMCEIRRPEDWVPAPLSWGESPVKNSLIQVEAGDVTMGKPWGFPSYGWDNEYPQMQTSVPSFEASKFLITNLEFLGFVEAGGYQQQQWWSKEGWQWRTYRQAIHPTFWVCEKGCKSGCGGVIAGCSHCQPEQNANKVSKDDSPYRYRSFCEETSMPWDWPAEVNYHEAKAYAAWKGPEYRLLTEAEHHAIRDCKIMSCHNVECDIIYDEDVHKKFNTNMTFGSSSPVNMFPANQRGFHDVFGNVWQWVEDHFNGLPGSETHYLYDDFSSPTYDGKHNVIMGGSWISTGDEASSFARYAFRRHFFQHAGFRLARSCDPNHDLTVRLLKVNQHDKLDVSLPLCDVSKKLVASTNTQLLQETPARLDQALYDEYSVETCSLAEVLGDVGLKAAHRHGTRVSKALDIGCGCGRLTFQLSKKVDEVLGFDYCGLFVKAAQELVTKKQKVFYCPLDDCQRPTKRPKRGDDHIGCTSTARLPEGTRTEKVTFKQFTWIPNEVSDFDLVVHHILDRVSNKRAWLMRLWEIIKPTGIVVISGLDGWTKERLEPLIGNNLECVETLPVEYSKTHQATTPDGQMVATVWRRKVSPQTVVSNGTNGSSTEAHNGETSGGVC